MFDIFRKIYLKSFLYDKKISKTFNVNLRYRPSSYLLKSIVNIQTKKINVDDIILEEFWINKRINENQSKKLNNFFWLFSIDLKSSNSSIQSIIKNWLELNFKYNHNNWNFNITSKRIISWLSNSKLTYDESNEQYRKDFDFNIQKQAVHLINQIDNVPNINNRIVGIAAIILVGLCYKDEKIFIHNGLGFLKRITKN